MTDPLSPTPRRPEFYWHVFGAEIPDIAIDGDGRQP